MNQSSIIAAGMVIAYVVFITVRGELPCYMEVIGVTTGGQCPHTAGSSGTGSTPIRLPGPSGQPVFGTPSGGVSINPSVGISPGGGIGGSIGIGIGGGGIGIGF